MDKKFAIEIDHVTRVYKRDEFEVSALDDVTLKVPEARFVAIMGPSGSGKSPERYVDSVYHLDKGLLPGIEAGKRNTDTYASVDADARQPDRIETPL